MKFHKLTYTLLEICATSEINFVGVVLEIRFNFKFTLKNFCVISYGNDIGDKTKVVA